MNDIASFIAPNALPFFTSPFSH